MHLRVAGDGSKSPSGPPEPLLGKKAGEPRGEVRGALMSLRTCVHLCPLVCTCAHMCSPVYSCLPVYTSAHLCIHVFTPVLTCTCAHLGSLVYTCLHLYSSVFTCVHMCIPVHTCVHLCTSTHTCPAKTICRESGVCDVSHLHPGAIEIVTVVKAAMMSRWGTRVYSTPRQSDCTSWVPPEA